MKKLSMKMLSLSLLLYSLSFCLTADGRSSLTVEQSDPSSDEACKVYLECRDCNAPYFRRGLSYVDLVRDPKLADVHVFVTEQSTGGNGKVYGLNFIGLKQYADLQLKLDCISPYNETEILRWEKLLKTLHAGLLPFVARSGDIDGIEIMYKEDRSTVTAHVDPWDFWVFRTELSTDFEAEEQQKEYSFNSSLDIDRINETWKLKSELYYELDTESYLSDEIIRSNKEEAGFESNLVYSINSGWSLGAFSEVSRSSFYNASLSASLGPAIEYNIFPWDRSDRKVFVLAYHLKYNYFDYMETTVFNQNAESRMSESLRLSFILRQPWGEIENTLEGSHYFHDFSKSRISLETDVSIAIAKGLALFLEFEADIINDQLYLPAGEMSREEILLNQQQLATNYRMELELGIRYTFGSIYNRIVNERFKY